MNERLANEKISKLLLSLAIPSILAQMVTLLYNLVDRIYIGRMEDGALAIAGIGLCSAIYYNNLPLLLICLAVVGHH